MWGYNVIVTGYDRVGSMAQPAPADRAGADGPGAEAGSGWE
jgi:hypothetical protein